MNLRDLISMGLSNLWRRKLRSFLTILGVVIGSTAIVIMLSIGIAYQNFLQGQLLSSDSLTLIRVNTGYGGGRGNFGINRGSSKEQKKEKHLNDEAIKELQALPNVAAVYPSLEISTILLSGKYQAWAQVMGVPENRFQEMKLSYSQGAWPAAPYKKLPIAIGSEINYSFRDPKSNEYDDYRWLEDKSIKRPDPKINMLEKQVFIVWDSQNFYGGKEPDGAGNDLPPAKKFPIQADAIIKNPQDEPFGEYSNYIITDLDALKTELHRVFRNRPWPGQPTTKSGKALPYVVYSTAYIRATDFKKTKDLVNSIKSLGYEASSSLEFLDSMQQTARQAQLLLGGIGAISMLVAAISIANTMMMSIYERTREIGVFKVLGCSLANIRNLFLIEAGFIGLIGGLIGTLLSFILSFILNIVGSSIFNGSNLSTIPIWLVAASLLFSTLIGMIAGLMPALRAMKLSPLEALRTQ